jgi:Eukaryotic aspartyl protease
VNSTQGLYLLQFNAVYANSQAVSIPGGASSSSSSSSSLSAIVDSRTADIVVPSAAEEESIYMYALISPDIKPVDDRGTYGIECDKLEAVFKIGGRNYMIQSRELSVGEIQGMKSVWQTLISAGGGYWIIGAGLKYYYSVGCACGEVWVWEDGVVALGT